MSPPPPRSPRVDAQRNRERLLDVARDAFAADPDTSLNAIAKQAGVGPGTLYRHFPTREDLILTLYHREVVQLAGAVDDLLRTQPPLAAFRTWSRRLTEYLRIKHGLGEALNTAAARELIDATYAPVLGAIRRLLDAGEKTGDFRDGLDEGDVLLLMGCLWRVAPGAKGRAQAERLMDAIIDALRPKPREPVARS
jgi:AcrR family transcriptional regulator